jgi:uncharacterized protein (DUF1778 family)
LKRLQLNIRTNAYQKNVIQANAEAKGLNLSEYVLTLAAETETEPKELRTRDLK